uniref:Uncharacterized protein n=1 Tax=Timema cristinae TaxID=61476 RepID=A0A7R9D881_TIMCR|nr:unnamed protein product [Timema cristinae]
MPTEKGKKGGENGVEEGRQTVLRKDCGRGGRGTCAPVFKFNRAEGVSNLSSASPHVMFIEICGRRGESRLGRHNNRMGPSCLAKSVSHWATRIEEKLVSYPIAPLPAPMQNTNARKYQSQLHAPVA